MITLELKKITKHFTQKTLYTDLSFTFQKGCYAILGPNGIGKTVLLEMLAGISPPDSGEIFLNQIDASGSLAYKRHLAYVPSKPEFFPLTTGSQFLNFIDSLNTNTNTHKQNSLISALHLTPYLKTKFADMSLGTQKKLFLVSLSIGKKSLLILDEPSNGLDAQACKTIASFLIEASQHAIIIMATHDKTLLEMINPIIIQLTSPPITHFNLST